jgi:acyl-CoA thioester hydrolase
VREQGNLNVLTGKAGMTAAVSETLVRVNYSETDQMGVVYHARYLVWLDVARCDHLRHSGMSYRELEEAGLRLVVSDVSIKYRQPARYDDLIRIRCWVRAVRSRKVEFGYVVEHADDGRVLATASTSLLALDTGMTLTRLPARVGEVLHPIRDPVRLGE